MNIDPTIRVFADDLIVYRKTVNNTDIGRLQKDLDTLGEWTVENAIKINPCKCKAISFTRARVKIHEIIPLGTKKFRKRAVTNTWE
jgi:hypothetical protein